MKPSIGLRTELYTHEVPYVFAEFQRLVGDSYWLKRVKALKDHLRGQPSLRDFLREENRLAFLLAACSKVASDNDGMLPLQATTQRELYPAFAFMAQTLSIINSADDKNAQAIIGRIRGGMKNPPDLRAMDLELHTANHFVSRGYRVEWPEMAKSGTFDLLVPDLRHDVLTYRTSTDVDYACGFATRRRANIEGVGRGRVYQICWARRS